MTSAHQTRKARVAAEQRLKAVERELHNPAPPVERHTYPAPATRTYGDGLTRMGRVGQCQTCGAFRTDGRPPTVHRTDCVMGPDGSRLPPLNAIRRPSRSPGRVPPPQRSTATRR